MSWKHCLDSLSDFWWESSLTTRAYPKSSGNNSKSSMLLNCRWQPSKSSLLTRFATSMISPPLNPPIGRRRESGHILTGPRKSLLAVGAPTHPSNSISTHCSHKAGSDPCGRLKQLVSGKKRCGNAGNGSGNASPKRFSAWIAGADRIPGPLSELWCRIPRANPAYFTFLAGAAHSIAQTKDRQSCPARLAQSPASTTGSL